MFLDQRVLRINETEMVLNCDDALTASLADMLGYKKNEVNQICLGDNPNAPRCEICGDEMFEYDEFDLDGDIVPQGYYCPFCDANIMELQDVRDEWDW